MIRLFSKLLSRLVSWFVDSPFGNKTLDRIQVEMEGVSTLRLKRQLKACGSSVSFQFPVYISQPNEVEIGDDVSFAAFVHIWGGGGVKIGKRVMIGSHTALSTVTHDYSAEIMYETVVSKPIVIGDDVWISSHAVILPGITVGSGAVIGAGCVVTKDVPPRTVVIGVPGRVLRERNSAALEEGSIVEV